ncbi:hypothetical protein NL676_005635 [Syzygium grande]|nr:hypothetical protein NL676_005635 [Syzygium grande]
MHIVKLTKVQKDPKQHQTQLLQTKLPNIRTSPRRWEKEKSPRAGEKSQAGAQAPPKTHRHRTNPDAPDTANGSTRGGEGGGRAPTTPARSFDPKPDKDPRGKERSEYRSREEDRGKGYRPDKTAAAPDASLTSPSPPPSPPPPPPSSGGVEQGGGVPGRDRRACKRKFTAVVSIPSPFPTPNRRDSPASAAAAAAAMEDHRHHRHHRPHRISVPPRAAAAALRPPYPAFSFPPSTPTPTPSKSRGFSLLTPYSARLSGGGVGGGGGGSRSSLSFLFLLLFSLRSLYGLLPFLRSSPPSFSLFPFSFLVSLLSFLLSLSFSLLSPPSPPSKSPLQPKLQGRRPLLVLASLSPSQNRALAAKSVLLAVVFLLRFQALRYCSAAAMILAELSGNVAARFLAEGED